MWRVLSILRAGLERGHPLSDQAFASAVFGLYTGLVYLTPILGGFLADRLLGRTPTIILGAWPHVYGPLPDGLRRLVPRGAALPDAGLGLLSRAISPPRSARCTARATSGRADAFQIFYLGINAGVIILALRHWHSGRKGRLALRLSARRESAC
jgi:POT family proton-dependent oligopeptide transporter